MALLQVSAADQVGALNNSILDYVKLLFILAGILVLAWIGLRYWMPRLSGMTAIASGNAIQVVARQALEPRKTLYVVKAGGEYLLLGSSEQEMQLLTRLDSAAVEAELVPAQPVGFKSTLDRFRVKGRGDAA